MRKVQLLALALCVVVSGCAVQAPAPEEKEAPASLKEQRQAMENATAAASPRLKKKIALGRVSNETKYGVSLLRTPDGDPVGKQVADMVSRSLVESGRFLVLERPDIASIKREAEISGRESAMVGADILVVGSLTEFGRKTVGQAGFASNSKKQVAFAKMELRAVDVRTGQVLFGASGAGEASTETSSTFGFGSRAGYDGTLNDAAIRQAVASVVSEFSTRFSKRPWQSGFIELSSERLIVAGGKSQGLSAGMRLGVFEQDTLVASPQTGLPIPIPGKRVATVQIQNTFGATEEQEASIASLVEGSVAGYKAEQLVLREEL